MAAILLVSIAPTSTTQRQLLKRVSTNSAASRHAYDHGVMLRPLCNPLQNLLRTNAPRKLSPPTVRHTRYISARPSRPQRSSQKPSQSPSQQPFQQPQKKPAGLTPAQLLSRTVGGALLLHVFLEYGFTIISPVGISMMPTIGWKGDLLVESKHYRRGRDVHVGDVISAYHPVRVEEAMVKRVIGMPGDFVLRDTPGSGSKTMIQVPAGHCWVAGDNQQWSRDSRLFGPVPLALIRGKIIAKVWPPAWIDNGLNDVEGPGIH